MTIAYQDDLSIAKPGDSGRRLLSRLLPCCVPELAGVLLALGFMIATCHFSIWAHFHGLLWDLLVFLLLSAAQFLELFWRIFRNRPKPANRMRIGLLALLFALIVGQFFFGGYMLLYGMPRFVESITTWSALQGAAMALMNDEHLQAKAENGGITLYSGTPDFNALLPQNLKKLKPNFVEVRFENVQSQIGSGRFVRIEWGGSETGPLAYIVGDPDFASNWMKEVRPGIYLY